MSGKISVELDPDSLRDIISFHAFYGLVVLLTIFVTIPMIPAEVLGKGWGRIAWLCGSSLLMTFISFCAHIRCRFLILYIAQLRKDLNQGIEDEEKER